MSFDIPIEIKPGTSRQTIASIGVELDKLEQKGKKAGSSLDDALAGIQRQFEAMRAEQAKATNALGGSFGAMADALKRTESALERIRGPAREHERNMQALGLLYRQGRVSASEFTAEVNRMNAAMGRTPKPGVASEFGGGLSSALVGGGVAGVGMAVASGVMSGVGEIAGLADAYTNLSNRMNQVAASESEHAALMQRTQQIASTTRSEWTSTGETFVRLTNATKEMGLSQGRVLQLTETIGKAFSMSGASASEASAGMLQLTQALASGKLQGDEFRSIAESIPSVLDLVAKQMHVSRGALKQLASEGKITSDVIIQAFTNAQGSIDAGFAKTAPTISQQWTVLKNQMTETFGKFAQDSHVFEFIAGAIEKMANALGPIVDKLGKIIGKVQQLGDEKLGGINVSDGTLDHISAIGKQLGFDPYAGALELDDEIRGANLGLDPFVAKLQDVNAEIAKFTESRGSGYGISDATPWGHLAQKDMRTAQEQLDGVAKAVHQANGEFDLMDIAKFDMLKTYLSDLATSGVAAVQKFGDNAASVFGAVVPDALEETIAAFGKLGGSDGLIAAGFNKLVGADSWNTPDMIRDQQQRMDSARKAAAAKAAKLVNPWDHIPGSGLGSAVSGLATETKNTIFDQWDDGLEEFIANAKRANETLQEFNRETSLWEDLGRGVAEVMGKIAGVDPWDPGKGERLKEQLQLTREWNKELQRHVAGLEAANAAYADWMERTHPTLARVNDAWTRLGRNMEQVTVSAVNTISDSLSDAAIKGEFSFKRMVDAIAADMTRIGIRSLITFGAQSAGLPGFADGGSYTAPMTGGAPDSIPFRAMVSPGERIDFTPRGKAQPSDGPTQVIVRVDDRQIAPTRTNARSVQHMINTGKVKLPYGRRR